MRKFGRLVYIYIIMVLCAAALSGCGAFGGYEGKELVDRAKQLHTALEAAHIQVEDVTDGHDPDRKIVQEIWYRFQGDVMQYMYIGRDLETGEEYYEFNNGTELDTWHTGDAEWSFVAKGSEGYYSYSRAKRHYFADGALLFDDHAAAVTGSEVTYPFEVPLVRLTYDADKIAQSPEMAGVTEYEQCYTITDDGTCWMEVYYTQNGEKRDYSTMVFYQDPAAPIERVEPPALSGEITEAEQ
ncbi:MAG: hypothetical protein J6N15_08150 [Ruminiclostridium sp.]|nr:hypothetical protein [Ruminiclostridium sp.]